MRHCAALGQCGLDGREQRLDVERLQDDRGNTEIRWGHMDYPGVGGHIDGWQRLAHRGERLSLVGIQAQVAPERVYDRQIAETADGSRIEIEEGRVGPQASTSYPPSI